MPKGKSGTLGTGKEALLFGQDEANSKGIAHAPMESARLQVRCPTSQREHCQVHGPAMLSARLQNGMNHKHSST